MTSTATNVPIPLQTTIDSKEETTKWTFYDQHNRTIKGTVPVFDGTNTEHLFHCLTEWDNVLDSFTGVTVAERFRFYRLAMTGMARNNWDTARRGLQLGAEHHAAGFALCIRRWKGMFISTDAIHRQVDYLRRIRRPKTMTVQAFRFRIETIISYLRLFPRDPGDLVDINEAETKEIILKAMPLVWQERFKRAHKLYQTNLTDLVDFLEQEREFADEAQRRNNSMSNRSRGNRPQDDGNRQTQRPRYNNRNNYRNNNTRLSNDSPCPVHGGSHSWGQCFQNPNGSNYRPVHPQRAAQNRSNQHSYNRSQNTHQSSYRSQSNRGYGGPTHRPPVQTHTVDFNSHQSYFADNGPSHFDGADHEEAGTHTLAQWRRPSSTTRQRPSLTDALTRLSCNDYNKQPHNLAQPHLPHTISISFPSTRL